MRANVRQQRACLWGVLERERTYAEVPGVDLQGLGHVAGDTHELGQNKRALLRPLLRDHELH